LTGLSASKEFYKVMVAIDGSPHSKHAAEYAILIAKKHDSELIVIHVLQFNSTVLSLASSPRMESMRQEAKRNFEKIRLRAIKIDDTIKLRTELIASPSIVGGVVDFAEKEKVDLIVVGTKGRSGLKRLLLGSVAAGIINYAHCPVMIVK
jgi:nucleotide-binding universal stress UspA family protein